MNRKIEPKKTGWTYVIFREYDNLGFSVYSIRELYDFTDGSTAITDDPCYPIGSTIDELQRDMRRMQRAFKKPVYEEDDGVLGEVGNESED